MHIPGTPDGPGAPGGDGQGAGAAAGRQVRRDLAASGGMFYGRESPGAPLYVQAGDHFEAGDPLYIVEVMKMFNKVYAPFAGTIDEVLVEGDGVIISKGQPLFKITPDEKIVVETPRRSPHGDSGATARFLDCI
jgi:hypothetical protein